MAEELSWNENTKQKEIKQARDLLVEFGGRVPDKLGATLREATVTDLRSVFNAIDTDKSGFLDEVELKQASTALGFQLNGEELKRAFRLTLVEEETESTLLSRLLILFVGTWTPMGMARSASMSLPAGGTHMMQGALPVVIHAAFIST